MPPQGHLLVCSPGRLPSCAGQPMRIELRTYLCACAMPCFIPAKNHCVLGLDVRYFVLLCSISTRWRYNTSKKLFTVISLRRGWCKMTMDPAEVEFLAEKEPITIIPNFSQDRIYLVGVCLHFPLSRDQYRTNKICTTWRQFVVVDW